MSKEREFKGVWIPREIWLDERLNMLEKGILTEIDSLDNEDGCSAGNEYLAKFCQCSETKVSTAIKKLIEFGYIYVKSFDGRIRILKSRLSNFERQNLKELNAEFKNFKEIKIDNNINNKKEERVKFTPPTLEEVKEYAKSKQRLDLAEKFYNYFTEGNWQDSKGNKVKNWKQKFITWCSYGNQQTKDKNFTGRQYENKEINSLYTNLDNIVV